MACRAGGARSRRTRASLPASDSSTGRRFARVRDRAALARRGAVPAGCGRASRRRCREARELRERYARWFEETAIPTELVEQAVLDAAAELRRLTREQVGLPEGEEFGARARDRRALARLCALPGRLAHGDPGQCRSAPLPAADLVLLTSHEIYGGHHTHRVWQEVELVRGRGQVERTLDLLWSPEAVISEGIAMTGPELLVGDGQELAAEVLGRLGFAYDAEVRLTGHEGTRVVAPDRRERGDAAQRPRRIARGVREYSATWSLQPDDRVAKQIDSQLRSPSPPLPAHVLAGPGARCGARRRRLPCASASC